VNCSTLPANLAESELFGARKGAFTDAREDRDGLFARAHRGTLFLDEVGELPSEVQPKLLRALETGRIRPLGSAQEITVDARIIAATNHPLDQAVLARQFRADLLFRLDVIRIDIPPLRERPEDLEPLTDFFVERIGARLGRPILGISEDGLRWLLSRPWVGNARELSNCIERAIAFAEGDTLTLADFSGDAPLGDRALPSDGSLTAAAASGKSLDEVQIGYIQAVIAASGGNMAEAARRLGIDRRTLYRRLATARSGS
jgi:DNA-binding NtrC family response regulator